MNNMSTIWQSRLEEHIKETRMYMKYMLNDHLVIVLIFYCRRGKLVQQVGQRHPRSFSVILGDGGALFICADRFIRPDAVKGSGPRVSAAA